MRPLEGIKVVEFATFIAAPTCARMLGEWGAEVIKVEATFGDPLRQSGRQLRMPCSDEHNPFFDNENPNKEFIALDLKQPEGVEALLKLLETADVFVTNTRPKALRKMGLAYEQLAEKFPKLIFADILGYGEQGPEKDRPAYDYTTFYARSGLMADLVNRGDRPINSIAGFGDHTAGVFLAGAVCAALYRRSVTGTGDRVDVGLYQTGLFVLNVGVMMAEYGTELPMSRNDAPVHINQTYKCADGEWIYLAVPTYDKLWNRIAIEVFENPELAADPRFLTNKDALQHIPEGIAILEEIFATKPSTYWVEKLMEHDIPHEKLAHFKDVLTDKQAWANNYLHEETYPNGEKTVFVNSPVEIGSVDKKDFRPSKPVGGDTRKVLKEVGYTDAEIDQMTEKGIVKA